MKLAEKILLSIALKFTVYKIISPSQHMKGFPIKKYSPTKTQQKTFELVSHQDEIAFMTKFYPPPDFLKFTLPQTSESSSQASKSQKSLQELSESLHQSQSGKGSLRQMENIKEYEVSEIKALNRVFFSGSKKLREKDIKQFNQSQFEYRQLLDQLTINQKKEKFAFSSQKHKNQEYHFQISGFQKSFVSEYKLDRSCAEDAECYIQEKSKPEEVIVQKIYRWNPPSEHLLRKQNRLQRIFRMLDKKITTTYIQFMNKATYVQSQQQIIITCKICNTKFTKRNNRKKCENCRIAKKKA